MRRRSNQRITKIKKDFIEELLKRAEAMDVADGTSIQPPGSDLIPYPDMNNLRHWTRDYLLKGLTKVYPVKLDTDGQTYLTTLIDGLPLFTKMTKSIKELDEPVLVDYVQPTDFQNVSALDASINCSVDTALNSSAHFNQCLNGTGIWHSASASFGVKEQTVFIHFVKPIKPDSVQFTNRSNDPNSIQPIKTVDVYGSNDNNNYTRLGSYTNTNQSLGGIWTVPLVSIEAYSYIKLFFTTYNDYGALDRCMFHGQVLDSTKKMTVETSKPGLWLSNLIAPISNSFAGSWLRHNLIHSNESSYDNVNSDVIGNYTWSFFQRGILHRTAGSSHNNDDSYCQHWSPSALGCISHDAIIIPSNNLRSTYTSYQMPVVPNDANMQYYEETMSKDVEYTFVDNNNNIPLTTTQFNGRVVGDGWVYELLLTPNGNGSGNNYGGGDNPEGPNGSNGGCITGTISYADSNQGTICTQEVNSCFQTSQSYFNPEVPVVPTNKPIGDPGYDWQPGTLCDNSGFVQLGCCKFGQSGYDIIYNPNVASCVKGFKGFKHILPDGTIQTGTAFENVGYDDYHLGGNCGTYVNYPKGSYDTDECGFTCFIGGSMFPGTTYLYRKHKPIDAENGIDLWLNIYDLKKQYESEGLPWSGGCGANRFTIDISTEKCTETYCTAKLIAHNVDINALGDISQLEQKVWSNATS